VSELQEKKGGEAGKSPRAPKAVAARQEASENASEDASRHYVWDLSFATNNEHVDEQHRQLFAALNSLLDAVRLEKPEAEVKKALAFLGDYTDRHFSDEEAILLQHKFPDFARHKKVHEAFKKTVRDLDLNFKKLGGAGKVATWIENMVGDWLTFHIKGMDLQWAAYIQDAADKAG
jgi:hemerythrin-like metal-binding protein